LFGRRRYLLTVSRRAVVALFLAAARLCAQSPPADQTQSPSTQQQAAAPAQSDQTGNLQENNAEHDITYLESRLAFRYDYKSETNDTIDNRFRLQGLWGFGPQNRMGFSLTIPVLNTSVPGNSAFGLGDIEAQFGGVFYRAERIRFGAAVTLYPQTATNKLLGGASTDIKPAVGFTALLNSRIELNCIFNYQRSIHTVRGSPTNQFEPDFTLSTERLGMTIFTEWDSYYLISTEQFAQTLKFGVSRSFGKKNRWVVAPYYSVPVSHAGTLTQYIQNVGIDVNWFPARWSKSAASTR
jgi:hypothetical protein